MIRFRIGITILRSNIEYSIFNIIGEILCVIAKNVNVKHLVVANVVIVKIGEKLWQKSQHRLNITVR
jgi:hypothetical protein